MQKEYTLSEIKEMCGKVKLIITNITEDYVMAINITNGMQHLFKIKKLNVDDYIKPIEPKHIKQVKNAIMEEELEDKALEERASTEKERIVESFKQLNKDNADLLNSLDNTPNKDDYVLMTEYDKEVNEFASEPTPIVKEEVKPIKKDPLITPKTKGRRGRKLGSKNKPKA